MSHTPPSSPVERAERNASTDAGRSAMLARVRAALAVGTESGEKASAVADTAPPIDESLVRLTKPGPSNVDLFCERAKAAGLRIYPCPTRGLVETLGDVLRSLSVRSITLSIGPSRSSEVIRGAVARAGVKVIDHRTQPGMQAHFDADAGVTDVAAAIAETGTLVVQSDHHRSRAGFIVPPIHIAMVMASQILPDMVDLWGAFKGASPRSMPSSLVLISGPSKTADIEGILITGVHGPREVHVVVVDERDDRGV